ncbi:MAG: glutamate-1-semialdehyde 2,1-aminomutase [Alphaproteobacteria bacterium 32-64-14]|nr:MAG: glutamate-1-semialdehyde 2,1-aminomutase [Alphaproteobacteria bacterium 32-64-14]
MNGPIDKSLRERAARVIPGGMYGHQSAASLPANYPQFFARAEGPWLWDVDGNRYLDFMCAYGPQLFGYAHPGIDAAYANQMRTGDAMTGPTALMVELAEAFTSMISHATWAMFCKNGSDATTIALMAARAQTKRNAIVRATGAYHGAQPWSNPRPAGTSPGDRAGQHFCTYNDVASLEEAVKAAGDDLAAIFVSPFRHDTFQDQSLPTREFAQRCRELADKTGALLIVDDVRGGFRVSRDCSWSIVGVEPDISCWGKTIANGHPISAVLGSDRARPGASSIFTTGSYWFAAAAMAASLATLELIRETDYLERLNAMGDTLRAGFDERAKAHGFSIRQTGPSPMPQILFDDDPDYRVGYGWCSEMLKRGVYTHPWHNMFLSAAMGDAEIAFALKAAGESFEALRASVASLEPHRMFAGRT